MQDGAGQRPGSLPACGVVLGKEISCSPAHSSAAPDWRLLSIVLLAAPLAALAQPAEAARPPAPDPVLARVDGHEVRGSEVIALIRRLPQQTQEVPMEKLVPAMVDTLINTQLIQEAAVKEHLENDPEVKKRLVTRRKRDRAASLYRAAGRQGHDRDEVARGL